MSVDSFIFAHNKRYMNKIERITSILIKLQSRRNITAQQIADEFGISIRTVYRDIQILEEAGVPIVSNMGVGYSIIEGYKLPPLMFSISEAIAFLLAEKQLRIQFNIDGYELFRNGMDKIRSVLKFANRDILEKFENYIGILELGEIQQESNPFHVLEPLIQSIIEHKTVKIEYSAIYNGKTTTREIEPVGLFFMFGQWYLLAWCKLRNDYRTFKLNRINNITMTDSLFEKTHPPIKDLIKQIYSSPPYHNIVLKVEKNALFGIGSLKYNHGLVREEVEGDYIIQTYKTNSLEYFARWYLSFADKSTIIESMELKDMVKNLINKLR